jgi:thiamine-phosphate pyrophosphorylase
VTLRGLYAVTPDELDSTRLQEKVRAALEGGIALLQYRRKLLPREGKLREAAQLRELCRAHAVPFIVNDDPALALALEADGVHLGRDDADVGAIRQQFAGRIIGASCYNDLERARAAVAAGADYVAFGSVFASSTKPGAVRAPPALFREAKAFGVPLAAIGGITLAQAGGLIEAGADLLAVISDLFSAPDTRARALQYGALFK